ncbi:hypothetical protein JST97_11615, partial [bacterium]|nr:hypothetical protein [bacterium]
LGTLMTTASRTPEGTSEVSRWLEACSATSEAARSAVVVLNAPGPERARELVGHLGASGPGLVGLLSRATQTPEGQAQTANLLQITAEKPESAKALVLALSQAGTEKAAAFFAQVAEPEPLGQNLRQAAAEPEGARLVKKMIAEVSAAPEAAKAIQTALASSEASARVRQSSPIKPQTAPDSASTEPPWAKQDPARESLTKAPPQVEVELLTQSASSPAAAAELLNHLSQAKAGPALSRFLARATQDAESSNALLGVLQQAEPPEGLARTLSHPETGQAVIKAASLARPATVSSLTERISQGQLASAAFVKVVAQAPLESLRGMLTNVAGDAGASSSFVKALCQAPPAAVQVLLTRVVGDQEACEAMVQALTVAAATPDGKAAVLSLKSALAAVMTAASPESTQELRKLLDEATPSADKKASATGDKASAAGSLVVPATTHGAASITRVSKAMEGSGSPLKLEIGHSLHKQGLGRYQEGERISGHHRVNVLVGGSKTIKQNEESEESLGVEEVKKAERHRNAQSAAPIEEIQAIQLFERGQRRGQSCSRCGSQFEGRVASCPNCQGEMLELLAVNSVNYRRAGFLISTQTDLVEVTVAARDFLDTDQSSIAGMRSPQRFVTLRDLLANCQQTVAGYATVTKTRTRRPKFD